MSAEKFRPEQISIQPPSWNFRESYVECLKEMAEADPQRGKAINWNWLENFELYLAACEKQAAQTETVNGSFPAITYWIILNHQHAVGKLTLHPVITPRLEKLGGHFGYEVRPSYRRRGIAEIACSLGIQELRRRGFRKLFSTCDEDNPGSRRVLEKNGGKLVDRYELPDWPKPVLKFEFNFLP